MGDLGSFSSKSTKSSSRRTSHRSLLPHGECEVCYQTAHGLHFGVLSCRACAAFFRRTTVLKREYTCRRANGQCKIVKNEKYICRHCRYKKCVQLGMTVDNVQLSRDVVKLSENQKSSKSPSEEVNAIVENSMELPLMNDVTLPEPPREKVGKVTGQTVFTPTPNKRVLFQLGPLFAVIERIFVTFNADAVCAEVRQQNTLTRMHTALQRHRSRQKKDVKVLPSIDFQSIYPFWEEHLVRMAEWFMFSKEFAKLEMSEKRLLFKNGFNIWHRLERLQMSYEILGERVMKEKILIVSDEWAASMDQLVVDLSSISDYDSAYLKSMFQPLVNRIFKEVLQPMIEMQLTNFELTYMLCQLAFYVEGLPLKESTQQAATAFRNRISDDLHEYYTKDLRQPNYSNRLFRIMTIIHIMENIQNEKANMVELARIFDFIKIDVSGFG